MPDALIVFASTTGGTREVAQLIARRLPGMQVRMLELAAAAPPDLGALPPRPDLLILGTPTGGAGDWHAAWGLQAPRLHPLLRGAGRVMLFALGDARAHPETFAGGLRVLHAHARGCGVRSIGGTLPVTAAERASPALAEGRLPGLVVDYRRHRHDARPRIGAWLSGLPGAWLRSAAYPPESASSTIPSVNSCGNSTGAAAPGAQ